MSSSFIRIAAATHEEALVGTTQGKSLRRFYQPTPPLENCLWGFWCRIGPLYEWLQQKTVQGLFVPSLDPLHTTDLIAVLL